MTTDPLAPLVDVGAWFGADPAARADIAARFDQAARRSGFLQVVGHGIPSADVEAAFSVADAFFTLPEEVKQRCRPADPAIYRGYSARLSESFAYSTGVAQPRDLVEGFILGSEDTDPGGAPAEQAMMCAPNVWPAEVPELRPVVWGLYLQMRALSRTLLDIAGLALGLDETYFRSRTDNAIVTMRANWYHRRSDEVDLEPGQLALGAHTDYGLITVLAADLGPGLQVLGPDRTWHDIEPLPGAFVINLGDACAIVTNDHWRSTIHRVLPCARPGGTRRRSFALFQDGNLDAVVAPLASCVSADHPSRYQATTIGQHLIDKVIAGRTATLTTESTLTTGERPLV
jgi:isopenicillin N synthase-like dioxygenase